MTGEPTVEALLGYSPAKRVVAIAPPIARGCLHLDQTVEGVLRVSPDLSATGQGPATAAQGGRWRRSYEVRPACRIRVPSMVRDPAVGPSGERVSVAFTTAPEASYA